MGTKYSSLASSGYNQSPPPDDGSTAANNLEKWSDVKTKIGDPIKTLADAINTALVSFTDFSGRISAGSETTVASDHMKTIECTGTQTESLLDATTAGAGYIVGFVNTGAGTVTIALQTAGNTLDGTVNGTCTIPVNSLCRFKVNSAATGYYSLDKAMVAGANMTVTEGVGKKTFASTATGLAAASTAQTQAGSSTTVAVTPGSLKGSIGFSNLYTSPEIGSGGTLAVKTNYSYAHGLGAVPIFVKAVLRCKTAELGYSIGDETAFINNHGANGQTPGEYANSTNVGYVTGYDNILVTSHINAAFSAITLANWVIVLRAWA